MELHAQIACSMPRELARKGIGWQDRAVYTEAIYYGRENLTDGVIARSSLAFWMPDMRAQDRARRLDTLRAAGALIDHPEGWAFPDHVWRKWGKSRAEVEAKRAEEAERVRRYRDQQKAAKDGTAYADRTDVQNRTDSFRTNLYETPEPKPEPKPYPEPQPSSSELVVTQVGGTPPADDDFVSTLIKKIAGKRTAKNAKTDPIGYMRTTLDNLERERPAITSMLTELPHLRDDDEIAASWYETTWKIRAVS